MRRYISLLLFIGLAFGQDCTADDGTEGVELWNVCYSIENTTHIEIEDSGLTGSIPPEIGNLTIFNLKGERIRSLIQARQNPGNWSIKWNGLDEYKTPVSTGIYIYKLTVGEKSQNRKMFLLK